MSSRADRLTVLSMGLGRDSLTLLALLLEGGWETPDGPIVAGDVDAVVFSDPGYEWRHTYQRIPQVRALCEQLQVRWFWLKKPPRRVWSAHPRVKGDRTAPPWMTGTWAPLAAGGWETIAAKARAGAYHRRLPILPEFMRFHSIAMTVSAACTDVHKIRPIRAWLDDASRVVFGRGRLSWGAQVRARRLRPHRMVIGFTAAEASRAAEAGRRPAYETAVFPLIHMGIGEADEERILARHGMGDALKSGCVMCPFQPLGWYWALRETDPRRWAEVVAYEAHALEEHPRFHIAARRQTVEEAVERWRARHPTATVDQVLAKSYQRCGAPPSDPRSAP